MNYGRLATGCLPAFDEKSIADAEASSLVCGLHMPAASLDSMGLEAQYFPTRSYRPKGFIFVPFFSPQRDSLLSAPDFLTHVTLALATEQLQSTHLCLLDRLDIWFLVVSAISHTTAGDICMLYCT